MPLTRICYSSVHKLADSFLRKFDHTPSMVERPAFVLTWWAVKPGKPFHFPSSAWTIMSYTPPEMSWKGSSRHHIQYTE